MSVSDHTLKLLRGLRIHVDDHLDTTHRQMIEAWGAAWNELVTEFNTLMMDVADARAKGQTVSPAKIARTKRATTALQAAEERLRALCDDLNLRVEKTLPDLVESAPKWQADLWTSQMPAHADQATINGLLSKVDPAQLEMIVGRTMDQIHASTKPIPWQIAREMKAELVKGVAFGDNPRHTAASIVRRIGDRFDLGLTRAMVISRTETLDAHRNASQLWNLDNADVLEGWEWIATLDRRTCASCWAQHGSVHDVKDPGPLDHQQGRCARLPKAKTWASLGFDMDEPDDLLPDARSTFDQLSPEDQESIMGRKRLDLLQSGKIGWADLSQKRTTTGWRDSYAPRPVSDLLSMAS